MTLLDRISRRQFLGGAAAVAAGAVFDACAPTNAPTVSTTPSPGPTPTSAVDVVFRGGTIVTMDPEQPDAEAVAVQGDSIVAVGSEAEVMAAASPGAMVVDLGSRVLLPGFNDGHCHRIDARGSETVEAVIQDALAGGWTSISEMLVVAKSLDELRSLDDEGQLRLRVNAYLAPLPRHLEGTEVQ